MSDKLREWSLKTKDLGFLTESDAWSRLQGDTPWHVGQDPKRYALERVLTVAEMVGHPDRVEGLSRLLSDPDAAVRYWAAIGLRAAGAEGSLPSLRAALSDRSVPVKVEAAATLVALGDTQAIEVIRQALASN